MRSHQVLLLNASYEPLAFCNWRRAVCLILKGKAVSLETIEHMLLGGFMSMPLVIKLNYYVKIPFKTPPLNRRNIMMRDQHRCQYCGCKDKPMSIDHIMPKSRGGGDEWENLVVACKPCNIKKGNRTPLEANMALAKLPYRPASPVHFEMIQLPVARLHQDVLQKYLYHLLPEDLPESA